MYITFVEDFKFILAFIFVINMTDFISIPSIKYIFMSLLITTYLTLFIYVARADLV